MKKILLIPIILFLAISAFSQQKNIKHLIGRWEIIDEQNSGASLEVIDDSTFFLSYNGEKKKIIDYKIDFTKKPIWFDFSTNDTASFVNVKSLLEIINDNTIKWQLFVDEERTSQFSSSKGEMLFLRKTKSLNNTGIVSNR
jgi:hypothetical protein